MLALRGEAQVTDTANEERYFINEYRVSGARNLPRVEVEAAVYPFLGPGRTTRDIELARVALEKAYADAGYQTVGVSLPPQNVSGGIVQLRVIERPVGRLRVKGARYSSPSKMKTQAPSLAEGRVLNFNDIPRDLAALNQLPDRNVTPQLRPGVAPDTVDVDLEVKETRPLHASAEVNNRQSPNTEPLRANVSVSANNLAQTGHSLGFSYQTAPQATNQVKVYSGYYLARAAGPEWLSLLAQATKQDSNVSTLGGAAVAGRGTTAGARLLFTLPTVDRYVQSATFGIDYKKFDQTVRLAPTADTPETTLTTPITYYPLVASYSGRWQDEAGKSITDFETGVTFHVRGVGSSDTRFNDNRYQAGGNFLILRADVSHAQKIWGGFQVFGRLHGQLADQPLLSGEQAAGGGLDTVRGYREAEVVGDSGVFGTVELRSPSLLKRFLGLKTDWTLYAFADAGWLKVIESLPDQKNHFDLASYGAGTRFQLSNSFDASIVAALPKLKQGETAADDLRILFQGTLSY